MEIKYDHYKKKLNFKNIFKEIFYVYIIGILTVLLFNSILIQAFKIKESSMFPQIEENTCVLVNKFIYGPKYPFTEKRIFNSTKNIKRGDVILFYSEEYINKNKLVRMFNNMVYILTFSFIDLNNLDDTRNIYIKRVIGIPGDSIKYQLVDNKILVFINGVQEKDIIKKNYDLVDYSDKYPILNEYKISQNEYYVLGDNRKSSFDSRFIGTINSRQIIGKSILKYWDWPFNFSKLGVIK
jgi:signal peptidase I